jgi:enoyl-CoA hydratase
VTQVRDGSISIITMDDGKANAFNDALIDGLHAALDESAGSKAVVLAGRPGVFSGGFDLGVVAHGGPRAEALVRRGGELLVRLYSSPVPVVAACTGHAIALGAVVLLASDYRVAAEGEHGIGLNEVAIGMPLPALLLALAEQRLNAARRTEAVLLARIWTPAESIDVGFVDEVVARDAVVARAVGHAKDLGGKLQPDAFALTSSALRQSAVESFDR